MSLFDARVEQCLRSLEGRCAALRSEGYCDGVITSAVMLLCGSEMGRFAAMGSGPSAKCFLDGAMQLMRVNAEEEAQRRLGELEGGTGGA